MFPLFSLFCHEVMGPDAMILIFKCWILSQLFYSPLSPSSKGSLVPLHFLPLEWYHLCPLRLFIFLLAILIPACDSSSPAFCVMHSAAYKLNKQGDNAQPWFTSFPIWNQSIVPCLVLIVVSWPAYRFLRRQIRWSGIPTSKEFPTVCYDPHS